MAALLVHRLSRIEIVVDAVSLWLCAEHGVLCLGKKAINCQTSKRRVRFCAVSAKQRVRQIVRRDGGLVDRYCVFFPRWGRDLPRIVVCVCCAAQERSLAGEEAASDGMVRHSSC